LDISLKRMLQAVLGAKLDRRISLMRPNENSKTGSYIRPFGLSSRRWHGLRGFEPHEL